MPTTPTAPTAPVARWSVLAVLLALVLAVVAPSPSARAQSSPPPPLVVLHGITGAFLADVNGSEVWPDEGDTLTSLGDDHLDVLALRADGITPRDPANPVRVMTEQGIDGIIDQSELCLIGSACWAVGDAYGDFFDLLAARGFTRGQDVFAFAYDWRLSTEVNGARLVDAIDDVLASTGADRVNVLAHSQGGLVARAAADRADSVGKIDRIASLGSPYAGATKALGVLDYQQPCQADPPLGIPGCVLNREKAQELATNWPGFLDLLPSRAFHRLDQGAIRTPSGFLSFGSYRNRLADRNLALVDSSLADHDRLDRWDPRDPDLELLRIIGTGTGTIRWVREFQVEECSGTWWWRSCELVDTFEFTMGDGDGTVPTDAADLVDSAIGVDYRGPSRNAYASGADHNELVRRGYVIDYALGFLYPPALASGARAVAPMAADDTSGTRIGPTEQGLVATELVARSVDEGFVRDAEGRVLGASEVATDEDVAIIPGGTHETTDDGHQYVLADAGTYTGSWTVDEPGEVEFVARAHADGDVGVAGATGPVRVPGGARLEVVFTVPVGDVVLEVDVNDDGRVDRRVPFARGDVSPGSPMDVEAPRTRGRVVERTFDGTDWWAEVDVEGDDDAVRIDSALDVGEVDAVVAPGRLRVPAHGELHLRSVDAAGNVEAPHEVVVLDDAPSQARWVDDHAAVPATERGRLEFAGDVDVWGLEVAETGRHRVHVTGGAVAHRVVVRDAGGAEVASGTSRGKGAVRLDVDLGSGRHTVEVTGVDGDHDVRVPYRVRTTRVR